MDGLSHDEKKSSPGSPDGVAEPSRVVGDSTSSTATSSGNLAIVSFIFLEPSYRRPTPARPLPLASSVHLYTLLPYLMCILILRPC